MLSVRAGTGGVCAAGRAEQWRAGPGAGAEMLARPVWIAPGSSAGLGGWLVCSGLAVRGMMPRRVSWRVVRRARRRVRLVLRRRSAFGFVLVSVLRGRCPWLSARIGG